ncbi:unnamed protein product [Microthlaspi erraticum]|uniref:Uncharacterized protein n=1 Tax=Microthlaspi erraticum TaxID=1685480 RepID=A0A6D2IAQ8_9BRAS|nr:unnamed protein product [Microthlaspi erraticum]
MRLFGVTVTTGPEPDPEPAPPSPVPINRNMCVDTIVQENSSTELSTGGLRTPTRRTKRGKIVRENSEFGMVVLQV